MATTIKAIQQNSIHQIQSGQVIVDLNSVVKELVENSIDAGATSIEVRFRDHGLESVEVVDNGEGISEGDYESVALKHHTSKLTSYHDLDSLNTFGFRGEALASLCALSHLHIITARQTEAPRGHKLDFEVSGKLKSASVVAAQKGTRVVVERLFHNLPVRKKELEKNIKREYGKVLALLQAYACVSTGVRFVVSNQMPKANKTVAFSTAVNTNTRDNITNVFGAKTMHALVKLDLTLDMQSSLSSTMSNTTDATRSPVTVQGHVSRPVLGDGRQAPDRQFFFVNSRPCALPQVAKVFNEVYRSFNISQSPFIFANLLLDTHAYDVNVSPDKRTILLHDQSELLESLKTALLELFDAQEQSVPQSKLSTSTQSKLPSYQPLTISRPLPDDEAEPLIHAWMGRGTVDRNDIPSNKPKPPPPPPLPQSEQEQAQSEPVKTAFDRMRPPRTPARVAEITIGDRTTKTVIGNGSPFKRRRVHMPSEIAPSKVLRAFAMPGSQMDVGDGDVEDEDEDDDEDGEVDVEEADERDVEESEEQCGGVDGDEGEEDEEEDDEEEEGDDEDGQGDENDEEQNAEEAEDDQNDPGETPVIASLEEASDEEETATQAAEHSHEHHSAEDSEVDSASDDNSFIDEEERQIRDDERIAHLIHEAEEAASHPSADNLKRASQAMKGSAGSRHSVLNLVSSVNVSLDDIKEQSTWFTEQCVAMSSSQKAAQKPRVLTDKIDKADAEAQLSLTVSKADFGRMKIAGQFNLGFIIALRPDGDKGDEDHLFIIDQHAADEKFNFERFSHSLNLEAQRLAQPKQLYLTAVEEEIILAHSEALSANGFVIETDTTGSRVVGERCKLVCLPMSRETTFDLSDLEELLHLLSDQPSEGSTKTTCHVPRPSKVRKMLAMRACRSSIMVGKTLSRAQMRKVVGNLGEMDKPWNCPHGRPTMRHLAGLGQWHVWDGMAEYERDDGGRGGGGRTDWRGWVRKRRAGE